MANMQKQWHFLSGKPTQLCEENIGKPDLQINILLSCIFEFWNFESAEDGQMQNRILYIHRWHGLYDVLWKLRWKTITPRVGQNHWKMATATVCSGWHALRGNKSLTFLVSWQGFCGRLWHIQHQLICRRLYHQLPKKLESLHQIVQWRPNITETYRNSPNHLPTKTIFKIRNATEILENPRVFKCLQVDTSGDATTSATGGAVGGDGSLPGRCWNRLCRVDWHHWEYVTAGGWQLVYVGGYAIWASSLHSKNPLISGTSSIEYWNHRIQLNLFLPKPAVLFFQTCDNPLTSRYFVK